MAHPTGARTGSLLEVMRVAERIGCNYVNVYPEDVLKGTCGHDGCDAHYEKAFRYGHEALARIQAAGSNNESRERR